MKSIEEKLLNREPKKPESRTLTIRLSAQTVDKLEKYRAKLNQKSDGLISQSKLIQAILEDFLKGKK